MSGSLWQVLGLLDEAGQLLFASPAAARVLGAQPVGRPFVECLCAEDQPRFEAALPAALSSELTTLTLRTQSRVTLRCRFTPLQDTSSQRAAVLEVCELDAALSVAEHAGHTQLALEHKTAELQSILRALPDLFFRFDAEGRFLDFSAPSKSALYASPDYFLGKRPSEVLPRELAEAMERTRERAHATGELATLEYELPLRDGLQHFEARYVPFLEQQTIAMVRNITERRQAEADLRASEARLHEAQKLDAVGRLAGGVAHDFNNLLMIISGHTFALARHLAPLQQEGKPLPALASLTEIRETCRRATGLTRQLLALAKRQPAETERVVLDLREVLQDMHSMLSRVIGENIHLSTQLAPDLRAVWADRAQLEQIVLNLVLNARDAMPRGGQLSVRAYNVLDGQAEPRTAATAPHVAVCVADTGIGMDAETRRRMFEPFFTTKSHGTGLGLFTVQRIVQESGAQIEVSSRVGVGTTVILQLLAADEPARKSEAPQALPLVGGEASLLVVEDEDAVRALVVSLLRDLGYAVTAAAGPAEAQKLLADLPALDLLLSDVVMPGGTGWDLATKVRTRFPGCSVLFMSGHPIGSTDEPAPTIAREQLLQKPFTPEALAARVRTLLKRPGS